MPDGNPVPGIAPAAKQQGRYVAALIKARLGGEHAAAVPLQACRQSRANRQAQGGHRFRLDQAEGNLAWWIWGIAHIYFLIGLRHRLSVAMSWLWIHARDQRAARLITQGSSKVTRDPSSVAMRKLILWQVVGTGLNLSPPITLCCLRNIDWRLPCSIMDFLAAQSLFDLCLPLSSLLSSLMSIRVANQYERSVVFRLGKFNRTAGPGLYLVWPFIEWQTKLDLRTVTADVEQQEGITRDNVPIKVDAVIWFRIVDPERAVMRVKAVVICRGAGFADDASHGSRSA